MKILFLDIDGVLNCILSTIRFGPGLDIEPQKATMVHRIQRETGCYIVLSSGWRLNSVQLPRVRAIVGELFDVTPNLGSNGHLGFRGLEIEEWLAVPRVQSVERYAILDDHRTFLSNQSPHLFLTNEHIGLTDEIADRVIAHLNQVAP